MRIGAVLTLNILFVLLTLHANCQIQKTKGWEVLESQRAKKFVDEKGQSKGCDALLECMSFDPVLHSLTYDQKKREFSIDGMVRISGSKSEWMKLEDVYLYLAQPVNDTLVNMRKIGVTVKGGGKDAVFPNRRGDFRLKFIAEPNDKLYFFHPGYGLVEYNIDKVVSGEIVL
jgi:hypothetical protein